MSFINNESQLGAAKKSNTAKHTEHPEREDQNHSVYTYRMGERVRAVMRASPERDLLCEHWRGRAVTNSPILRLDESTVNAGSQKSKREAEMG